MVRPIPREKKQTKNSNNYYNNNSDDSDSDSDNENRARDNDIEAPEKIHQKWPLFGERLINGDINKHVYEYITRNHRKGSICLLSMLFPCEYTDEDKDEEKEKEKKKRGFMGYSDDYEDQRASKKIKKINITEEIKRKILYDIVNNCLGEKNNYALFKYIYLMPARSILYNNLYEEIVQYLKEDKTIDLEKYKENEEKNINNIKKEIDEVIAKANKRRREYLDDDDDYNNYDNEENVETSENTDFKCLDNRIKKWIGFVSDIIPGEVVREQIEEIANSQTVAMYRLSYFTKYFKIEELRKKLLEPKKVNEEKEEKNILNDKNTKLEENVGREDEKQEDNKKDDKIKEELNVSKKEEEKKEEINEKEKEKEENNKEKNESKESESINENEDKQKEKINDDKKEEKEREEKEEKEKEGKEGKEEQKEEQKEEHKEE